MPSTLHNRRNRLAAAPHQPAARPALPPDQAPAFLLKAPPRVPQAFPGDVVIPPHRGAVSEDHVLADAPPALFTVPERPAAPPPRKKKATAKRRKPPKRTRAIKGAKAAARRKPASARANAGETIIFAMPPRAEPLVDDRTPMPLQPLPRSRALARAPHGGLLGAIAEWIGSGLLWLIESGPRPAPAKGPSRAQRQRGDELKRLREENESLRLQLEALLALHERRSPVPG